MCSVYQNICPHIQLGQWHILTRHTCFTLTQRDFNLILWFATKTINLLKLTWFNCLWNHTFCVDVVITRSSWSIISWEGRLNRSYSSNLKYSIRWAQMLKFVLSQLIRKAHLSRNKETGQKIPYEENFYCGSQWRQTLMVGDSIVHSPFNYTKMSCYNIIVLYRILNVKKGKHE